MSPRNTNGGQASTRLTKAGLAPAPVLINTAVARHGRIAAVPGYAVRAVYRCTASAMHVRLAAATKSLAIRFPMRGARPMASAAPSSSSQARVGAAK